MTGADPTAPSILIAAFSGRALAQSARCAGFRPLVVDCFGDLDTRAASDAMCCLPARVQVGFRRRTLIAALEQLASTVPHNPPLGLVLGAGFECNPGLVAALAERFSVMGNTAETISRVKDPDGFFGALSHLGIRHPETRTEPPATADGWLMKRVGGSGGLHIHRCPPSPRADRRRYYQREIAGDPVSLLAVASGRGTVFAPTRQWASPQPRRPFRYGGAVSGVQLSTELEAQMIDISLSVIRTFGLVGLISLDFVVSDGEPLLLEVNPRPGATLDLLDDDGGRLFAAHVEAVRGGDPATLMQHHWSPPRAAAAAYLYADRGAITVPAIDWPAWAADRPPEGTHVARGQPLATVTAQADTASTAERLCRERLRLLEQTLYERMT